jgi:enoyl-CoA hydratase/carnithine racemase
MTSDELRSAGLVYEVTGEVAVVTLDRPEVRNAQTPAMWRALAAIGDQVADEVRVVVVRGSGQTFSAGLDRAMLDPSGAGDGVETVAGLLSMSDEDASAAIEQFQRGFTWLRDPRFVSIAVVQGYAIGAGFQLALSCDLRVLAEGAQLCMKESALGLVPDLTAPNRLSTSWATRGRWRSAPRPGWSPPRRPWPSGWPTSSCRSAPSRPPSLIWRRR